MSIEYDIFKKSKLVDKELIKYGFIKENDNYKYSKDIIDNSFRVDIFINKDSVVTGKIYDKEFNDEEYTSYRIESNIGSFAALVREEYIKILNEIKDKCFIEEYFIYSQSNRITTMIKEKYGDDPNFEWEKFSGFATFKNSSTNKWYGIIMNIDKTKLGDKENKEVEVINVKLDSKKIEELVKKEGFYPAYHMNKKYWITIILDDTLDDKLIMKYIDESHSYTVNNNSSEWIIPSNPNIFDVISYLNENETVTWHQSNNIHIGDIIYIYVGAPYSAIMYKCIVKDVGVPSDWKHFKKAMTVDVLERYDKDKYSFKLLNKYGVTSIRGPRHMTEELSRYINN